jgi:hypothetical protein
MLQVQRQPRDDALQVQRQPRDEFAHLRDAAARRGLELPPKVAKKHAQSPAVMMLLDREHLVELRAKRGLDRKHLLKRRSVGVGVGAHLLHIERAV